MPRFVWRRLGGFVGFREVRRVVRRVRLLVSRLVVLDDDVRLDCLLWRLLLAEVVDAGDGLLRPLPRAPETSRGRAPGSGLPVP